jgi:hypothetical protein
MNIDSNNLATKADIARLDTRIDHLDVTLNSRIDHLDVKLDALDKRLSVIQWIGAIFLALNGSLIATLLWVLATVLVKLR